MKINKINKKGFTVIEILIIVIIIAILVSVVLVSMINARNRAQDNSAFATFKTVATSAYMCLMNGGGGIRINNPGLPNGGNSICNTIGFEGTWPNFAKTGWGYDNFSWCNPFYNSASHPTTTCAYDITSGTCGGNISGDFCFMMEKDGKYMWCTLKGCYKEF